MKINQRKREEVESKYKWDLENLYKDTNELDNDIKLAKDKERQIVEYKDKELDENTLYELVNLDLSLSRLLDKLMVYINLKVSEDQTNSSNQLLYNRVLNTIQSIVAQTSFVNNKILRLDYDVIKKFISKNEKLKEYEFMFEVMFKDKKHSLSDSEEKLLSNLSKAILLPSDAYDMLVNSDMKFGNIKDENQNMVELTDSNYSIFIKSKNRKVREKAFKKYFGEYGKYSNTIGTLYEAHLQINNTITSIRKYNSMLESDLISDNLSKDLYDNLINTVYSNISSLHRYYKIKKEMLNYDEFHIYDVNAPIVSDSDKTYSFSEAKDIILDTFNDVYSSEYTDILKRAFDERWIDVYNNVGKYSGAFSSGVYDSNPYVLINFEGKINDISALAHELGHSVNTYLSKNSNPYQYYDYPLVLAEVASLTNEIIFNVTMIEKEKNLNTKLYLINDLLRLYISNFFDSTLFAKFELDVHNMVENNNPVNGEYFSNLCLDLYKEYYGKDVVVDEQIKYRWEIYSHLYTDFYLYKYAIGISCATYCATKILSKDKKFISKYIEFLKVGSSKYPNEALLLVDIDVNKNDFILNTIEFFNKLLDELEKTYNSIK